MKNWKIGTRIMAGFGAVIAIAMALGIFAWTQVGAIEKTSAAVTGNALPKVYSVGKIAQNVHILFSLTLQHAASNDRQKMAELESEVRSVRSANAGIVTE